MNGKNSKRDCQHSAQQGYQINTLWTPHPKPPNVEVSGLCCFSRRSDGVMGWASHQNFHHGERERL